MASDRPHRLPIGISDFRNLREAGLIYVDKTDFVTKVLTAPDQVVLVPRPRRFGKTLNISTIRYFVEKSGEDRSALFEGLAVWSSPEARAHHRRYPVISLTFKDILRPAYDAAFAAIRAQISWAYREHAYLLKEGALKSWEAGPSSRSSAPRGPTRCIPIRSTTSSWSACSSASSRATRSAPTASPAEADTT